MKKIILFILLLIPVKVFASEYDLKVYVVDFNSNSCNPYKETDLTKSKYYLMNNNKEIINIITFDSDCSVTLRLEQGIYYLQQQTPGIGYMKEDKVTKVVISDNSEIRIKDNVIRVDINVFKYYNNYSNPYKNTKFNVYDIEKFIGVATTDDNGFIFANLRYGTYTFKQISTYDNYPIGNDIIVNIKNEEKIEIKSIENELKYKIKIIDESSEFLYDIYDENNNKIIEGKNRIFIEEQLFEVGNYKIIQSKVTGDYLIDGTEYKININHNDKDINIKINNNKNIEVIHLPKTTEETNYIFVILLVIWIKKFLYKHVL